MNFEQDDHVVLDLPFAFSYYGSTFTQVTVCSNGWIAMGAQDLSHCWNVSIPCVYGPEAMIAPFWDDLYQGTYGGVFAHYDEPGHRFIVEWSRMKNEYNDLPETFEVILLDPALETTATGDGSIIFQYHTVNNVDAVYGYATAGIENLDHTDGVLYTYWNVYPDGALPLASGRAIRFVPVIETERGHLRGLITNASNGGTAVAGAGISPEGSGCRLFAGSAGSYFGAVPVGVYTVRSDHRSFAPDSAVAVIISSGDTATVDFALTDIAGPEMSNLTAYPATDDTIGPYEIDVDIHDETGVAEKIFYYRANLGPFETVPLVSRGGDTYRAEIPGRSLNTRVDYYVYARDDLGLESFHPSGAPSEGTASFYVAPVVVVFEDDMETEGDWLTRAPGDAATAGVWTRVDPNATYLDTIMVQPEDDHTPDPGLTCYITGQASPGAGQAVSDVDGGSTTLVSPYLDLSQYPGGTLSYYRWYTNDTGNSPGEDIWQVIVSGDGENWAILELTSASDRSWVYREFRLEEHITLTDSVQIRFVAQDIGAGSIVEAGVDDVKVFGFAIPGDHDPPDVEVVQPNGGEQIVGGSASPYTIRWNATDDTGVTLTQIFFSIDGGTTYPDTLAGGALDSTFNWWVPDMDAPNCRIRVACFDSSGKWDSDASNQDFEIVSVTGIADEARALPLEVVLSQNLPNPFNPMTEIRFGLPREMRVSLSIYSVEGRLVRTLADEIFAGGFHHLIWDGRDSRRREVSTGIYLYRLATREKVIGKKMLLLK